ncbi:MAG: hypothetical protein ACYYNF_01050 [Actinomycetes bacterium]|jgi:hypothetical protein|nr:hypothetical protein [Candidatus Nanopelagicales bacterium]MDP4825895.1 hypothetical protein [Candidatus Nanopelagicales bacterium]MDP4888755.1 hypothetical protein [Candidatus Nanopelagicales bacterium]
MRSLPLACCGPFMVLLGCTSSADLDSVGLAAAACGLSASDETTATPAGRTDQGDINDLNTQTLVANAARATRQHASAVAATAQDARWGSLADATGVLESAAVQFAAAAELGQIPTAGLTSTDWDNLKAASNVVLLECRDVASRWQQDPGQN